MVRKSERTGSGTDMAISYASVRVQETTCPPNYEGNKSLTLMELFPDARYFLTLRPKRIFDCLQRIVFGSFARFPYCLEKGAHKFYEMLVGQFVQL